MRTLAIAIMGILKNVIIFLFAFYSTSIFASFPEGFESTVPPTGWVKFIGTNGLGTTQSWQVSNITNSGSQAAYARYENVSGGLAQDWLVTPQFTPTLASNILTFMQRQSYTTNYGSVYKVFISTGSQTTHGDFTLVDTQIETDFTYYYTAKEIDLSAYVGVPIYVAFVLEQDDGDNWLIDDVALTASAICVAPDALAVSAIGKTFATASWNEPGSATQWQIEYGVSGFTQGSGTQQVLNAVTYDITGLSKSTTYDFYVVSVCAPGDTSAWTGPFSFSTLTAPIIPDYLNDFSNFPGLNWTEASGPLLTGPTGTVSDWESDFYLNTAGDTSAKVNLYFFNSNHWLISPDFDLNGGSYELNLDAGVTGWNVTTASNMGSDDQVDLLISTDYGANWSSLYQWNASNTPSNTGTPIPTVNLTPYTGTVRFALLASDGTVNNIEDYDFFIDNFSITEIAVTDDGDGVPSDVEATDGTDPNDECSFLTASISLPVTSTADCDGDGVPNNIENTDGTDPNDECSFLTASISLPVTSTAVSCADVIAAAVEQLCQITAAVPPNSVPELQDTANNIADTLLAGTDICGTDCDIAGQLNALIAPEPH